MDVQERIEILRSVGEEIVTEDELRALLEKKDHPVAYDGFEPSGRIHIAQGLLRAITVNKLTSAGCEFIFYVADWHAKANNKMGGDLEVIQKVGKYFIEVWKACGMDLSKVKFVWASDLVKDDAYWQLVLDIAMNSTVKRIVRCAQIMGRSESDALSAAQILYPCMQAADIFKMGVDICQLGMDQRKVNMLARELAEKLGYDKPVILSHHMLMGLGQPPKGDDLSVEDRTVALKMSKSNPDSAIFMMDSPEEVERKLGKAYCPQGQAEENPVLEYAKYILFERLDALEITRPEKFGGDVSYLRYEDLEKDFVEGKLHPMDLKKGVAAGINELLEPVREHFEKDADARELQEFVVNQQVTR